MSAPLSMFGYCPFCRGEWSYQHDGKRYSRIVSLCDPFTDRTEGWQCPDCCHTWPRESITTLSEHSVSVEGET